jgi:hypothetical protein
MILINDSKSDETREDRSGGADRTARTPRTPRRGEAEYEPQMTQTDADEKENGKI